MMIWCLTRATSFHLDIPFAHTHTKLAENENNIYNKSWWKKRRLKRINTIATRVKNEGINVLRCAVCTINKP